MQYMGRNQGMLKTVEFVSNLHSTDEDVRDLFEKARESWLRRSEILAHESKRRSTRQAERRAQVRKNIIRIPGIDQPL